MTLGELKDLIEMCEQEGATDETEVRLATQPAWPFENSIRSVKMRGTKESEINEIENSLHELDEKEKEEAESELNKYEEENEQIVYILEGSQLCYGSKTLWEGN